MKSLAVPATVVALFLVALTLRPQLVGITPLIPDVERDLGVSHTVAGLLGTIPVLCMGIMAPIAPFVAARLGTAWTVAGSIAMIGIFGLLRAIAGSEVAVVGLTTGIGVGMGLSGALLPVIVKERLPARPVAATASYSTGLQLGSAASAGIAVPLALAGGSWRVALLVFSGLSLLVLLPWIAIVARDRARVLPIQIDRRDFLDRRGWLLAVAFGLYGMVYYGLTSWLPDAYREFGWTSEAAGGLVALLNAAAIAGAVSVGLVAARPFRHAAAVLLLSAVFALATGGLAVVTGLAPLFAVIAGFTNGALFPLLLALPLRLTTSPARVAVISSVMLGGGYALAAVSPVALGAVRDASGSFEASLAALSLVGGAFVVAVAIAGRGHGEQTLRRAEVLLPTQDP